MYTDADNQFDAENIHGWYPTRWVEHYECDNCERGASGFSLTRSTGEDDLLECPYCGNPHIAE